MEQQTTGASSKEFSGASDAPQRSKTNENVDVEVLPISFTPEVRPNLANVIPAAECRRSSRKKIIKFDVRDLLNKNRKPHKIQIEARIDSNVPNTSKACGSISGGDTASTASGLIGLQDLSSKQKAFMEKSAIFRRFSISQDQSKPPPPPPIPLPPTILSKVGDKKDVIGSMNLTGKRLNRSRDYYNNALLKPKQTASLIVAQVESNVRSVELKNQTHSKARGDGSIQSDVSNPEQPQQKRRGRPPKIRSSEPGKKSPATGNKQMEKTKLSPEKAKNWKEYKACLAEQHTKKNENLSDPKGETNTERSFINSSVAKNEEYLDSSVKISSVTEIPVTLESNKQQICLDSGGCQTATKKAGKRLSDSSKTEEPTETLSDKAITSALEQSFSSGETSVPRESVTIKGINKSCFKEGSEEDSLEKKDNNKKNQALKRNTCNIENVQERKELKTLKDGSIPKTSILCGENDVIISQEADVTSADTLSDVKSLSLRRDSLASENSCSNSLSSITALSASTHKSEVSTSKDNNASNSPDEGRKILEETKRSKRLQRKATDNNCTQSATKNTDVYLASIANKKVGHSELSHDSDKSLHENNILPENEKSCDASIEIFRSGTLPSTDITECKDSQLKTTNILERNYGNDSPKSSISKHKQHVFPQQRKSVRKRSEYSKHSLDNFQPTKVHQKVQKNYHIIDISQDDAKKDETKEQDKECHDGKKYDSKQQELINKAKLQSPNTILADGHIIVEETLIKTQAKENIESEKKSNAYKSVDERLLYVKRKSLRSQRDGVVSSSLEICDENEHQSGPSNKEDSNKPQKEENTQPVEECFSDMESNADKLTYFKGKYQEKPKDHIASSSEENEDNNKAINVLEEVTTISFIDANIVLKEDHKTKHEISAATVRKSLRKQKDMDLTYSPENALNDKSPEIFKTNENLVLHTLTDDNSQPAKSAVQIEGKSTIIEKIESTQRMSLRKQKDEDKSSPHNVNQDKLNNEKGIVSTTLTNKNFQQAELSTTIFNDLESVAECHAGLLDSTRDDTLSTEEYEKSSRNPTSTQRTSLRNIKDECTYISGNSQSGFISENSQNATGKGVGTTILAFSNIQSTDKHQPGIVNPLFTQKMSTRNKKDVCEPSSPERNIVSIVPRIVHENSEYETGPDDDVTDLTFTNNKSSEEHQTRISKTTPDQEKSLRNTNEEGVPCTPEENIVSTNNDNSQQEEQGGMTSENSQHFIEIDVEVTALTLTKVQSTEDHQTCVETPTSTQINSIKIPEEDKKPYCPENAIDEKSKIEKEDRKDNYPALQSKTMTDKSKSVTRKSFRKQKCEIFSYAQNITSTNSKEFEGAFATNEIKEALDNHNIGELKNEEVKMQDVPIPSTSLKGADLKEQQNNVNDPTVYMPTTEVYQTLEEDAIITKLSAETPTTTEKTCLIDMSDRDGIAPILILCEDNQNLSEPPKIITTVSIKESHQLPENFVNVSTKCEDKQKSTIRTSLRKQKETTVLSNVDTFENNKEKDLATNVCITEDQFSKTNKGNTFGNEDNDSSSPSSLEYVKNENQIECSYKEYMVVTTGSTDESCQTGIEHTTTVDISECKEKGDATKEVQHENPINVTESKGLEFIYLENIENDKLNITSDKDEPQIIGEISPEFECSQPLDDAANVKRENTRKLRSNNLHVPDTDPGCTLGSGGKQNRATELSQQEDISNRELSISSNENTIQIIPESKLECKLGITSQIKEELTKATPLHVNEAGDNDINNAILESSNEQTASIQSSTGNSNENKVDAVDCRSDESSQTIDLPSSSQTDTTNAYVIKNLSIETNTLLDILRTVQSNEEAAVEAKKACDSVVESQDTEVAPNTSTAKKVISQKKLIDTNSSSSRRSNSASPLALKHIPSSPCRSDTSSPLTLKKWNSSPSRSDTSSPLSLNKKITRRYERRSRRGEDSTHKTLEETFAEIAALSSKAVLEMSTKPDYIKQQNPEETNSTVINEGTAVVEKSEMDINEQDKNEDEIKECSQKLNQPETCSDKVETFSTDSPAFTCYPEEPESTKYEQCKTVINPSHNAEVTHVDPETSENNKINAIPNIIDDHQDASAQFESKNSNMNTLTASIDFQQENKQDDKQLDNPIEKSDSLTQRTKGVILIQQISETSLPEEKDTTKIKEDESLTPKKRDSTLSKSECKSANKKSSKKSKTPENIELSKLDDNTSKSATPPPKRGRKAINTTKIDALPSPTNSNGGKKKVKKDQKEEEAISEPKNDVQTDSEILSDKSIDEKMAKKKRQRKLKEAFEAALNEHPVECKDEIFETPVTSPTFDNNLMDRPQLASDLETTNCEDTSKSVSQVAATEPEEDPDPLKDIEKFIEDGVNLLKKAYKIDEDSVDNVIIANTSVEQCDINTAAREDGCTSTKEIFTGNFETPADTPIATPSATPPPKSPESSSLSEEHSSGGVRRSHRIKLITKTPKALVGRGLVRDKERFSIKDDVETKSHYTLDDHLLDLAEVEAKNAKFLKEMEERLSNFQVIKENEYKCERVISKEARKMICDCFLTAEEEVRGELACGEDCLNRLLMIECGPECNIRERCTNKRFQKLLCSPCRVFRTEKKGFGIMADIEILPGEFIMEYVGEVIDTDEFERRRIAYSQDKNRHYYFMALRSDAIIDATIKGNISRFINHSCDPNAETQKWTVNGELRIGFFSRKSIMPGEEITFNYQYQRYGREAQRCYCESVNCRGWIGQEPTSDEGEQIDDDDDESDEEDEEEDNSNLLEDDDDSDASVSDPEEVQKKLEMAAAQAAAELAPITLEEKPKHIEDNCKEKEEITRLENEEEDSKSKFKKLLSKMAEKVAAKHKQTKREQKLQRKKKSKVSSSELANKQRYLEDPDIEDEVEFLSRCGLKNQSDTLRLSRLMVRAKLVQTRLNLLEILRKGELPCRRLFLDYHGLRLVHGWMSEDAGNMQIRLALLLTLDLLPIANKTMLTDSKVMQVVRSWCGTKEALSPNEDSLSSNSNSQDGSVQPSISSKSSIDDSPSSECGQLQKLALKLVSTWDGLPEIFRIPKKERIEQMKEHEREADRQYAETEGSRHSTTDIDKINRFGKRVNATKRFGKPNCSKQLQPTGNTMRSGNMTPENLNYISKAQRREMFAAKVARDEAEKRMAEERKEFETKCRFFGLDPKKTRPQDVPFCVNPATGQWYSVERKPINTPPSYAHVQVPEKHKSTNPVDYQLPAVCATLPPQWKYSITPLGQIYYYHVQYRVPQWEPPTQSQLHDCEINIEEVDSGNEHTPNTGPDSSDDDDDILVGMDAAQLKAYIDRKVEARRQKRYQHLVDERAISPRREEDRVYNQLEVRKYKENKEKIRKRKEEIRRKRADVLRQSSLNMCTLGSLTELNPNQAKSNETEDDVAGVLPIQDYLLSSDEDDDIKIGMNSPLIDKIVEGDKIVDELDALTTKRPLKRSLPPHREINEPSSSTSTSAIDRQDYKKRKLEKKDKRKPKEQDAKYRKTKEKFRCEIAGIIVHHLKPYRKDTCTRGRIQSNDDFNHLARKLTHFVMIKELKYCESVGQTLVVTESVKNKSREFIKKYMTKYGDVYVKPSNDPEFKDIPFTL